MMLQHLQPTDEEEEASIAIVAVGGGGGNHLVIMKDHCQFGLHCCCLETASAMTQTGTT